MILNMPMRNFSNLGPAHLRAQLLQRASESSLPRAGFVDKPDSSNEGDKDDNDDENYDDKISNTTMHNIPKTNPAVSVAVALVRALRATPVQLQVLL